LIQSLIVEYGQAAGQNGLSRIQTADIPTRVNG
jgi:hypothetical protein